MSVEICSICTTELRGPSQAVHFMDKVYHLYRCRACDLVQTKPLPTPEELRFFYGTQAAYDHSGYDIRELIRDHDRHVQNPPQSYEFLKAEFLKVTRGLPIDADVLEVGCNLGAFIEMLQPHVRFRFYGIEINKEAAEFCKKRKRFLVECMELAENPFPGVQFDCILLLDVFEHLPNPNILLAQLRSRLKPGGLVLLSLPNASAFFAQVIRLFKRIKGKEMYHSVEPPFHLFGYSRKNLVQLFGQNGFELIHSRGFQVANMGQSVGVLKNLSLKRFSFNLLLGRVIGMLRYFFQDEKLFVAFKLSS